MNELWSILGHFGWPDFPRKSLNRQSSIWHQPPPRLDPSTSTLPFMQTTFSAADVRPSTARTSFTQVDDEQQQQQPIPPDPTTQDVASSNVTQQVPEDRQQQSVQLPLSTLSTQSQAVFESETVPQTPQTYLTFLLISGRRRTMSFGPESSIGRVKELTWNSWPTEWQDERPPAPSYIRVLYLGRMLQDDETLAGLKLPTHKPQVPTSPDLSTIMHLSIRLYAPPGEGDGFGKKKKRRGANGDFPGSNGEDEPESGTSCCHCVIS